MIGVNGSYLGFSSHLDECFFWTSLRVNVFTQNGQEYLTPKCFSSLWRLSEKWRVKEAPQSPHLIFPDILE